MLVAWIIAIGLSSLVTLASVSALEQCLALYLNQQHLLAEQHSAEWLYRHFRYQLHHLAKVNLSNRMDLQLISYDEDKLQHKLTYHYTGHELRLTKDDLHSLIIMSHLSRWNFEFAGSSGVFLQPAAVKDWRQIAYVKMNLEFIKGKEWSWIIAVNPSIN